MPLPFQLLSAAEDDPSTFWQLSVDDDRLRNDLSPAEQLAGLVRQRTQPIGGPGAGPEAAIDLDVAQFCVDHTAANAALRAAREELDVVLVRQDQRRKNALAVETAVTALRSSAVPAPPAPAAAAAAGSNATMEARSLQVRSDRNMRPQEHPESQEQMNGDVREILDRVWRLHLAVSGEDAAAEQRLQSSIARLEKRLALHTEFLRKVQQLQEQGSFPTPPEHGVCPICLTARVDVGLVPCGHTVCCACHVKLKSKERCPVCRATATTSIKLYM